MSRCVETIDDLHELFQFDNEATLGVMVSYYREGPHETATHWIVVRNGKGRNRGMFKVRQLELMLRGRKVTQLEPETTPKKKAKKK